MTTPVLVTLHVVPMASQLAAAGFELRREVFIREQHVPPHEEFDGDDLTATHLVAVGEGDVVGVLRILFQREHVKIGRVAVRSDWRGRGVARAMMMEAMALARRRGETRFYLTAQIDKLEFYESLGFVAFGDEFEDGGMPHLAMKTY